jgi:hypothetical protein
MMTHPKATAIADADAAEVSTRALLMAWRFFRERCEPGNPNRGVNLTRVDRLVRELESRGKRIAQAMPSGWR